MLSFFFYDLTAFGSFSKYVHPKMKFCDFKNEFIIHKLLPRKGTV